MWCNVSFIYGFLSNISSGSSKIRYMKIRHVRGYSRDLIRVIGGVIMPFGLKHESTTLTVSSMSH